MSSLKKMLERRAWNKRVLELNENQEAPIMAQDETPDQVVTRHKELKAFAAVAQIREADRWEVENTTNADLTMLEKETAAKILATNPDIDLIMVLRCIGVPGPGYTKDLIYPLSYRVRDTIESRARRIRTTLQNLQPGEIHRISIDYLVSVIDDDGIGHKVRIKAVETLAKLALANKQGADDKPTEPVTVSALVDEIRAKVLGIKKVE